MPRPAAPSLTASSVTTNLAGSDVDAPPCPHATSRSRRAADARRSLRATGPRTAGGTATVARNATTHGIFSSLPVLPGVERDADWQAHLAGFVQGLTPAGFVEQTLAERAALLSWRLRRLTRVEATAPRANPAEPNPEHALDRHLDRLIRYEAHLTRQLQATLDRLATLQRRRQSAAVDSLPRGRPSRFYSPSFSAWDSPDPDP